MIKFISKILIFILVFQTFNDTWFVEIFGENVLKVVISVFVISHIKYIFEAGKVKGIKLILLFCLAMILSSMMNFYRLESFSKSYFAPIIVFIYFSVFSQYKNIKWLIFTILFSALFSALYCLIRDDVLTEYTFRKTGGMGDPNEFSTTILFSLGVLWALFISRKKNIILVLIISFVFLMSLLAAGSKTATLVVFIYLFIILKELISNLSLLVRIRYILISLSSLILVSYVFFMTNENVIYLLLDRFDSSRTSNLRFVNWDNGLSLYFENWFFGLGTNNYAYVMRQRYFLAEGAYETHNMYLKVLYELSFFGFIPFLLIIKRQIIEVVKSKREHVVVLTSLSFLLMGMSLSLSYEKYVWLIIGLTYNKYFLNFFKKKAYEDSTIYS